MKKYITLILAVILSIVLVSCVDNKKDERQVLRLHIRANGNATDDQCVKLCVRDALIPLLDELLGEAVDVSEAKLILEKNTLRIKRLSDEVLKENGKAYTSNVSLRNEFFPTRSYGDKVYESGYYDALIIELGRGTGDNWWCVVYPPLCYIDGQGEFAYKSKLWELFG